MVSPCPFAAAGSPKVLQRELILPGAVTARIQEGQKVLYHLLCELVEEKLPKA
jgi:hypothetical protein